MEVVASRTVRRFGLAVAFTFGLAALFHGLGAGEAAIFGRARVLDSAFGSAMRFVGYAHFTIGFAFMASGAGMRSARGRGRILVALLIGVGLCALFLHSGSTGARPKLPAAAVMIYFLVHEFRDEFFFYRTYGEAAGERSGRATLALLLGLGPVALAAAWSVQFVIPEGRDLVFVDADSHSASSLLLWWWGPVAGLLGVALFYFRALRRRWGSTAWSILRRDRPIWVVYLGIALAIALAAPLGGRSYSIVLLHVAAWWVFATAGLVRFGRREGLRTLGLWTWLRRSQRGFQALHVGLTIVFIGLALLWQYGFDGAPGHVLGAVGDPDAFYYWTIMHVTVSFVPKTA